MQFGSKGGGATGAPASNASSPKAEGPESVDSIEYPEEDINPEDIPF